MKKVLALFVMAVALTSVVGCGGDTGTTTKTTTTMPKGSGK